MNNKNLGWKWMEPESRHVKEIEISAPCNIVPLNHYVGACISMWVTGLPHGYI